MNLFNEENEGEYDVNKKGNKKDNKKENER